MELANVLGLQVSIGGTSSGAGSGSGAGTGFGTGSGAGHGAGSGIDEEAINALLAARTDAKANKDFAEADRIRDELTAMGITVEDTPTGPIWYR